MSSNSKEKPPTASAEDNNEAEYDALLEDVDDAPPEEEPDDEPDEEVLAVELQKLKELAEDGNENEPLDLLKTPELVFEIGDDPVRLYLKEIGRVELLNTDREFWLATRMQAERRIFNIGNQYPLSRGETSIPRHIYRTLYDDLLISWKRLKEDVTRLGQKRLNLALSSLKPNPCAKSGITTSLPICAPTWTMDHGAKTISGMGWHEMLSQSSYAFTPSLMIWPPAWPISWKNATSCRSPGPLPNTCLKMKSSKRN